MIENIITIIYLALIPLFMYLFWARTDVGGWSDGGCCHTHNLMSFLLGIFWLPIIVLSFFFFIFELIKQMMRGIKR